MCSLARVCFALQQSQTSLHSLDVLRDAPFSMFSAELLEPDTFSALPREQ